MDIMYYFQWDDAFGAPAEQYAIKNHIHPKDAVKENIKTFKGQIKLLGISFDWSREFSTTHPEYYKWTQWQFLKFYEHGMATKLKKILTGVQYVKLVFLTKTQVVVFVKDVVLR